MARNRVLSIAAWSVTLGCDDPVVRFRKVGTDRARW